jgi:hypothetical protein
MHIAEKEGIPLFTIDVWKCERCNLFIKFLINCRSNYSDGLKN